MTETGQVLLAAAVGGVLPLLAALALRARASLKAHVGLSAFLTTATGLVVTLLTAGDDFDAQTWAKAVMAAFGAYVAGEFGIWRKVRATGTPDAPGKFNEAGIK